MLQNSVPALRRALPLLAPPAWLLVCSPPAAPNIPPSSARRLVQLLDGDRHFLSRAVVLIGRVQGVGGCDCGIDGRGIAADGAYLG